MPLDAVPDHVAVAVPDIEAAASRWIDDLGGTWLAGTWEVGDFATRQLRFGNLGKLELLEPRSHDGFAAGFLVRYGPGIHHLTLKVPDLRAAVGVVEDAGYDVVDASYDRDDWHEAFLRPSQVGGVIVQLAWTPHDDRAWAELAGVALTDPAPGAPALLGPTLTHADLDAASRLWTVLGAELDWRGDDAFVARWGDAPLSVRVERDVVAGPRGLRFDPDPALPGDDAAGPGTLPG